MMHVPGFEIQGELGQGGMAQVFLATQAGTDRQVALKVVTADCAADPGFRRRFLRESAITTQLKHPHIVQVFDAGSHQGVLYLALEYVPGGDLNDRLERGMRVRDAVRVIADICRALDHAHERGFVHRDVKPENILFREDGSATLTDFGIARVLDSGEWVSKSGTVMGTPQYMSPEQAAGKPLDGSSDLYSLGVVFYRMITGDLPYKANSAVSIGIKHLQEPIPRLPNHLSAFQAIIDRCLAKRPEQRYPNGAEFSAELTRVASRSPLADVTITNRVVSSAEIRALAGAGLPAGREAARVESQAQPERKRFVRPMFSAAALTTLLAAGAYVIVQQPHWVTRMLAVTGIAEDPDVQDAWANAQSLHQDPNQSLATIVAGYRRVVNLDPDHEGARMAIAGLAAQWKTSVTDALGRNDLAQAETKLQESLVAFPEDPSLKDLMEQVTNRQHAERLLSSTQALLRSHGLSDIPSATAAIQAYQEVLRLAPGHSVAMNELNLLAQHYAALAADAAAAGEVDNAISFLDRASAADSQLAELDDVRQKIQQATTLQAAIGDLLQQASAHRAAGALINPPGENAAELYHRVLATDPDNGIATQGLNEVVSQLRSTANQLLVAGDVAAAQAMVDRASAVGLDPDAVNDMKASLEGEITRRARVASQLEEARSLLEQGFITEPPERNAVAMLRDVERLDPGNNDARSLLTVAAERLASVAQEAHDVGLVEDAKHYLELALTVTPDVDAWRKLRADWEKSVASQ